MTADDPAATPTTAGNTASEMVRSSSSTPLRVAFRELELYDTGDVAGAEEVFAPDFIDHNPLPGASSAIDGIRSLIAATRDGFSHTQHRILFHRELPDGWVVLHYRMTATHTGEAFGFPATGKTVEMEGNDIFRIVDGKIAELYHVEQMLKLMQQLSGDALRSKFAFCHCYR